VDERSFDRYARNPFVGPQATTGEWTREPLAVGNGEVVPVSGFTHVPTTSFPNDTEVMSQRVPSNDTLG
jgi:hypothetical protein